MNATFIGFLFFAWLIRWSFTKSKHQQRLEYLGVTPEKSFPLKWHNFWTYLVLIAGGFFLYMAWKTWTM